MADCPAVLNVKGQHFRCDLAAPHPLLAHASLEAQALWVSSDEHDEIDKKRDEMAAANWFIDI